MSSASRPKPWEVSSTSSAIASGQSSDFSIRNTNSTTDPNISSSSANIHSDPTVSSPEPSIPERPISLSNGVSSSSPYSYDTYGSGMNSGYGLGNSMYGSSLGGYGGGYGGGYSRLGGYGGGLYGGGYGGGMYGGGGYGGYGGGGYGGAGGYGANGDGNGFAESTQATFQLIESVIGAFGGFAQMLEATYMATHSSFFTMISVAEQFGNLKNTLGSFLGIYTLIKYLKKLLFKITGQKDSSLKINAKEFMKFENKQKSSESKPKAIKRISLKPLLIFLAMVIGTPYLLQKLVVHLSKQRNLSLPNAYNPQQQQQQQQSNGQLDISQIDFGRALYNFVPENKQIELELKEGDLVAILSKKDPLGQDSKWWRVRSRDGNTGYIPSNYLEIIQRKDAKRQETIEHTETA